jgi:tetratricopeptide (TPR) repeat protein
MESRLFKPGKLMVATFLSALALGCSRPSVPKGATEAVALMTQYNKAGGYDDAIGLGQEWLKQHPDDVSDASFIYQQIGMTYLSKAIKDTAHRDEWIQQAISYFDKDLSVHKNTDTDIELYVVGRGFESAGKYSTANSCAYFGRAIKSFEDERPLIQGDSFTSAGATLKLAPIREENEKALARAKAEFATAGCK